MGEGREGDDRGRLLGSRGKGGERVMGLEGVGWAWQGRGRRRTGRGRKGEGGIGREEGGGIWVREGPGLPASSPIVYDLTQVSVGALIVFYVPPKFLSLYFSPPPLLSPSIPLFLPYTLSAPPLTPPPLPSFLKPPPFHPAFLHDLVSSRSLTNSEIL